jgi:eukaryotic-like serine/threonine-protein kinase
VARPASASNEWILSGRYRLGELLGRGGMAEVYRGEDRVLGRPVAVKVLASPRASEPRSVERFRREARAAAGLSHPAVVGVFDTGADGDAHYIVMELIEGRTLAEVLRARGALEPAEAIRIADRVADGLAAAHRVGLIHRDVKPGNIMLTPDRGVKVMDFGIARAAGPDAVQTAVIMGTAAYVSPEQASGSAVDARSDLYSLGVVLYEMLTGRQPFIGDNPVAVAAMHVTERPDPPSAHRAGLPPGVDAVTERLMAKDPADRYASAEELRADLAAVLASGEAPATVPIGTGAGSPPPNQVLTPASAVPPTTTMRPTPAVPPAGATPSAAPPSTRRRPGVVAALVLAALLAFAAIAATLITAGGPATTPSPARQSRAPQPAATTAPAQQQPPGHDKPPGHEKHDHKDQGPGHGDEEG